MFIDTHAHLNFKDFSSDYPQVIERAVSVGVEKIINVGSNLATSKSALEIARKYDNVFAAVGLHPIHACPEHSRGASEEKFDDAKFLELAKNKKVVAIGETGLDYYRNPASKDVQKEVFHKSLNLASQVGKPVIIHSREAADDILSELMIQNTLPKGVFHCFSEDWNFAKVIIEMGFYISFTGIITFTKNAQIFEVIKEAPLEKMMIETDCPLIAPEPYRGQRNEPAFVVEVAKKIAEIKKLPLEKVAEQTSKNAIDLFALPSSLE